MRFPRRMTAFLLALVMAFSTAGIASADVKLNIQWPEFPDAFDEGTPPDWARVYDPFGSIVSTLNAINKEYNDQLANGYNLGGNERLSAWSNMVIVQFEGGNNVGNPWGQPNRRWGAIVAPYSGIAFSVKGNFAKNFTNPSEPLSNEFTFSDTETGVTMTYQMYRTYYAAYTDPTDESTRTVSTATVGKGAMPMATYYMQWAYAESSYQGYCPGIPIDGEVVYSGDNVYQRFYGPLGTSCIVGNMVGYTAGVIIGQMYDAWVSLGNGQPSEALKVSGAPMGSTEVDSEGNLRQVFENVVIEVDSKGNASYLSRKNRILSFEVENGEVWIVEGNEFDNNSIQVLVPSDTDLTSIYPVLMS